VKAKLAAFAVFMVACTASSTAAPTAKPATLARGAEVKKLDAGRVESLPTGTVYVRFVRFAQAPGYVINSKQHVPSVVFVETGMQRLILAGQAPIDLSAGEAKFHQSVTHQHLNHGSEASVWYSIAVWPSSARGQPLVDPIARAAFESDDIDRAVLPQVPYSQVLREVTLARLGTTGAHRFGGLSAFYVLRGALTIRSAHRPPATLTSGQGAAFLPDIDLQETNGGQDEAVFLEFLTTPLGKDFEVPLPQPPTA
jgi:quercetin dioxygenase-like cupin family protein